jgi:hypothetical protein
MFADIGEPVGTIFPASESAGQPTNGIVLIPDAGGMNGKDEVKRVINVKNRNLILSFEKAWMAGSSPAMTCLVNGTVKEGRGCPPSRA